ncbi:helix-turn-helix domain-containing protein [Mesobacillus foraminis]|uniref:helix-turn-helix domain-containing protein n=1 Tax=Mesobacillus foraminis TaxID=279826 RepID=UPI00214CCE61|nr:helix-turn-helix transcriptional regulator [Mesobacillus foraminis]
MNKREAFYIGSVLKKHRMMKQMSQEELAYRSNLDRRSISELERNKQEPLFGTVISLADALEINPINFITEIINSHEK